MPLHVNIEDLLNARSVESERLEFKEGWNPDAIYRSICAFANDFENLGGGYILIGVEEESGIAKRPVVGLSSSKIASIPKEMIGYNNLINPVYHPKLFIETVDGQQILVIWAPGGSNRPYEVPEQITAKQKRYSYYVRRYASSAVADMETQQELISLSNQIPFDDRSNQYASIDDISMVLIQDHLRLINISGIPSLSP
jgi:ATP-dependent DNA helicase RecG